MHRLLRHLLWFAILFGLAGNGLAVSAPCALVAQSDMPQAMAMADCDDGAGCPDCGDSPAPPGKSDKGSAPGCLAMVASGAILAVNEVGAERLALMLRSAEYPTLAFPLVGRELAPEPEPPANLV